MPHDQQAVGHSDADVLLHAVTDALLGAASLGDIGEMFPDTDPANRGRDSASMLAAARDRLRGAGLADRERRLHRVRRSSQSWASYKDAIRVRIAELLEIPAHNVGVKAKTGEGVDAVGREEAIVAQCVVLLERTMTPPESE